MSLAGLAGRIGVSKARAAQLIRSSRQGGDVPAEGRKGPVMAEPMAVHVEVWPVAADEVDLG